MKYPIRIYWPDGTTETRSLQQSFRVCIKQIDGEWRRPSAIRIEFDITTIEPARERHKVAAELRRLSMSFPLTVEMASVTWMDRVPLGVHIVDVEKVRPTITVRSLKNFCRGFAMRDFVRNLKAVSAFTLLVVAALGGLTFLVAALVAIFEPSTGVVRWNNLGTAVAAVGCFAVCITLVAAAVTILSRLEEEQ